MQSKLKKCKKLNQLVAAACGQVPNNHFRTAVVGYEGILRFLGFVSKVPEGLMALVGDIACLFCPRKEELLYGYIHPRKVRPQHVSQEAKEQKLSIVYYSPQQQNM